MTQRSIRVTSPARRVAACTLTLAVCIGFGAAGAAATPITALDPFYSASVGKGSKPPGNLIRKRRFKALERYLPGAHAWRVVYHSRSATGRDIPISGVVVVPQRKPPRGGFPIIAWAHQTTGIDPLAAPSLDPGLAGGARILLSFVKRGYAIAATDYEGLGIGSGHPYLVGKSEGRSVIDSVKAARELSRAVSRRWVTLGYSQGGHASIFAAQLSRSWGKGLDFRGVAAIAPPSHLALVPLFTPGTPAQVYYILMLNGLRVAEPSLSLTGVVGRQALKQLDTVGQVPLSNTYQDLVALPANELRASNPTSLARIRARLAANDPGRVKISRPVLLLQGSKDPVVPAFATQGLAQNMRAHGTKVTLREYKGKDHYTVLRAANNHLVQWIKHQLPLHTR